MFTLSKIYWIVFSPANLLFLILLAGTLLLFTGRRRTGRRLVAMAAFLYLVIGILPLGNALIQVLENRFPANPPLPAHVAGIVTLGGTVIPSITIARGQPALTDGSERLIEFIRLARRYPEAKLVFSGGSGSLTEQDLKETEVAKEVFRDLGFDDSRVLYESRSRNTYENALYTKELAKPATRETWILITSAMHMPRAMGCFRAAGWKNLIAYPVDFRTEGNEPFALHFGPFGSSGKLELALHEWIGLVTYWILGRTNVYFPGPGTAADN